MYVRTKIIINKFEKNMLAVPKDLLNLSVLQHSEMTLSLQLSCQDAMEGVFIVYHNRI